MGVKIIGLGASVPTKSVTNEELSQSLDTSDEWITTRTGIKRRHHSSPLETTSYLAYKAGEAAMKSLTHDDSSDIDTLIVATSTPDRKCPATAPKVATMLGLGKISAFDINAVCTGFVYGLELADALIRSGKSRKLMLIGADVFTSILSKQDRTTYPLFGDAAGAMILTRSEDDNILATFTGSDGEYENLITIPDGGTESALKQDNDDADVFFRMEGREVFTKAISQMKESINEVLKRGGLVKENMDYLVPHQANKRIIDTLSQLFDLKEDQALTSLEDYGNTSAASIPITLARHVKAGTINSGKKIVLTAFGGGITWGAVVLRWPNEKINADISEK
ncbi:ketoacyl-ACP synthase III [Enterobacteriaceae bacterium EKM102V]|uniref:beta-ketoacyl-ACP synthase III n=1 Tax=Pantoea TaxID=53335 RepID=UPI00142DE042|nr:MULTISPECIES: beta-ketoacyl-ACP synthase III [Pantoea]KAF6656664.1 ketoacyl-ACP synthase III [Enterobacteriaceae bacterium EKM102V]KAF6666041.1 ketoacyl-ACP synthase III [Pantoea sp. EKM103V]